MISRLPNTLTRCRGVYVLFMKVSGNVVVDLGIRGLTLEPSTYCYVGSALGPGGIFSRLKHHINRRKRRLWWHVDYLTSNSNVALTDVVYSEVSINVEEAIASKFMESRCLRPAIRDFGSSDKRSYTHLFRCVCDYEECIQEAEDILKLAVGPPSRAVLK